MWRTLLDVENAPHRRLKIARHVGVPALTVCPWTVLVGIDFHQRRFAWLVRRSGMHVQFSEEPAECELLLRRDVLIAEKYDDVLSQRPVNLIHRPVGQRFREIDALNFRTDDRRQFLHADRLIRRRLVRSVPIARTVFAAQGTHGAPCVMYLSGW